MASTMTGADVGELRDLAATFDSAAEALDRSTAQLATAVARSGAWTGHDADAFRGRWASVCRPRIVGVTEQLRTSATNLRRNADEQERASAAGPGGGSNPATGVDGEGASLWARIAEYELHGVNPWEAIEKLHEIVEIGLFPNDVIEHLLPGLEHAIPELRALASSSHAIEDTGRMVQDLFESAAMARRAEAAAAGVGDAARWVNGGFWSLGLSGTEDGAQAVAEIARMTNAARLDGVANGFGHIAQAAGTTADAADLAAKSAQTIEVIGKVAKPFAVLGAGIDGVQLVSASAHHDWGGVAVNTADLAADVMMAYPPTFVLGATWTAGHLIYDNREAIGDAASWAGDRAADAGGAVAHGASASAHALVHGGSSAVHAVGHLFG